MAYVIGSKKGKDIAEGMKSGETYKASDGSTWTKQSDGSVSVTHNGQTYNNAYKPTSGGNSQYTGSSTGIATNNNTQQAIKNQMNANSIAWWSADEAGKKELEATNKMLAGYLGGSVAYDAGKGTWSGVADGSGGITADDIRGWGEDYDQTNERPTAPQSDPRINALLNEILTRDDFSYDVTKDPLYEQYANMYRREGDRAMKETLAEAAAGAGGMNTYAVTAAQQANSYYNSQLNDKIPELYQLAYEMYLKDKESKVQDLGLLQNMDATQYARYRDTMSDWYNDKNFAYGAFHDAVQQGNWQANYDYKSMWDNNYFNNDNFWKNKEFDYNDMWANKEWDANRGDIEYERNQAEEEEAKATIEWYIGNGVSADAIPKDLIEKSGLDEIAIRQMVDYFKQQNAPKGTSSSSSSKEYKPKDINDDDDDDDDDDDAPKIRLGNESYTAVANACNELVSKGDKWAAAAYAKEAADAGIITKEEYDVLLRKNNPLLEVMTNPLKTLLQQ